MIKIKNRNSFTLVEVTIVIAVLAIVMVSVAGLFMNVQASWRAQTRSSDLIRDARWAMEFMSNEIRQAITISLPFQVTLNGNSISFYYNQNGDGAYPFIQVQYLLSNSNITRTFRSVSVPGSSPPWQHAQVLTRFVTSNQSSNPLFGWNASSGLLTIELTLDRYSKRYALRTKIRPRN